MSSCASASRDRCPPESVSTVCSHVSRPRPTPSSVASSLWCQTYPPARSNSCWIVWYLSSVFSSASPVLLGHRVLEVAQLVGEVVQLRERQLGLVDDGVGPGVNFGSCER